MNDAHTVPSALPGNLSFDNTSFAFAYKKDKELRKARWLFASMGNPLLLKIGLNLLPLAIKLRFPFTRKIIRNTLFSQFVGGESLYETSQVSKTLKEFGVQIILDYGVEGGQHNDQAFDRVANEFIQVINHASTENNIPFISIKITGIARFSLLEKLDLLIEKNNSSLTERYHSALNKLTPEEQAEWNRVVERLEKICNHAAGLSIGVLVDAEETWIQDPVDALTMQMMDKYNRSKAIVFNTIQLYRHDRLNFLKESQQLAANGQFILAVKLVRGAYMEKERARAQRLNVASPIQPDKETTDKDYNQAIEFCLQHIEHISTIIASHNEYSNLLTATRCADHNIPFNHPHLHFSQLYGMSDNITFNLARAGFSVSKYLPFGPIEEVIPYLMRRAQENSSVGGQTGRELGLIEKELKRRKHHS